MSGPRGAGMAGWRFLVVYLGLYSLATQIVGGLILVPGLSFPAFGTSWPMRDITIWIATRAYGITSPLGYTGTSGDTTFHWVQTSWLIVVSALAAAIWWRFDRDPARDAVVEKWFRLFVRFALAAQMFYFGMAKVIPTQFPAPSLVTLVEPVGNLSASELLWTFIGASTRYQMFTGWAEVAAGVLLIIPRTTTIGAGVALADMIQVFALNMAYDVGLKQISFHLILMSLVLLAPDARRFVDVFVLDRAPGPSPHRSLFATSRANRRALVAQMVFGAYLLVMFTRLAFTFWSAPGGPGSPRSPLYGIWDVARLSIDGQVRPSALNDYDRRWRRVIFDASDMMIFQRTDDSFAHYPASIDSGTASIALTKGNSRTWRSTFTFTQPNDEQLILDGEMDQHTIHLELQRVDLDAFRLLNNRFRWVRPPDASGG